MENSEIIIEKVTSYSPEVVDTINGFIKQLGDNFRLLSEEELQEIISSRHSFLFIARHEPSQQIIGMIMEIIYRIPYTRKAYIDDLFIDERFRKMGIATRLIQKTIDTAKEHNAAYIDFTSKPFRVAGNNLYEKLGFQKRQTNVYRLRLC